MIALLTLAGAGLAAAIDVRRVRTRIGADVWASLIDQIAMAVRDGHDSAVAVLGIALHGPPRLREAAARAVGYWRAGGAPDVAVGLLRKELADPHLDRICMTLDAVGAADHDLPAALANLRAWADADAAHAWQQRWYVFVARVAAWVTVVPMLVAAAGRADATVDAVAAACVCAWTALLALSSARGPRVFGAEPPHDPHAATVRP